MNCYIHIPFCRNKCGYCAFYSISGAGEGVIDDYLSGLERSLVNCKNTEAVSTLYFGGGTPTLLSEKQLHRLFNAVEKLDLTADCEISMEANPETISAGKINVIKSFVNRLSCGVQSFSAQQRKILGRDCSDAALYTALDLIENAGFAHWNMDLIYAVPGQSCADWEKELNKAVGFAADHVSCYNLTREEGARLSGLHPVADEAALQMWYLAEAVLSTAGIKRYEISNYAVPGAECRHNINVWRGGKLLAFGPSASGFDGVDRYSWASDLRSFLDGTAPEMDVISRDRRLDEIFAVNLRTVFGWTAELWGQVPQADDWTVRLNKAAGLQNEYGKELVEFSDERISLTSDGLLFWNSIAESLL